MADEIIREEKENILAQQADKRVYLSLNMFDAWKNAKIEARYSTCSDSDFAAHLLSLEYRRR